jgi:NAD(P)-dependent dehydrogenase (short-subunit alcohol dehydrogenase family)
VSALRGTVAVVTGATGNVGWGAAHAFAAAGAHVVATVRGAAPDLEALLGGDQHLLVRGDLAVDGDAERVREAALARFGRVDHVVASIGSWWQKGPVVEQSPEEFRAVLDSLLTSQFLLARAMLPWMRRHGGGSYTIVTGAGGEVAIPNAGLLGAAVMGVFGLSRALRAEHRGADVRVNELRIRARIERAARAGVIPSAVAGEVFTAIARGDADGAVLTYRQPDDARTLPPLRDAPGTA